MNSEGSFSFKSPDMLSAKSIPARVARYILSCSSVPRLRATAQRFLKNPIALAKFVWGVCAPSKELFTTKENTSKKDISN